MQYYLMLEGVIYGPYTLQEMQSFKLLPDTPVHLSSWSEGEWVNASELPELKDLSRSPITLERKKINELKLKIPSDERTMLLVVTDKGDIWNHDNPYLEKYKDQVLVVCLGGKKVTDKYECFVPSCLNIKETSDEKRMLTKEDKEEMKRILMAHMKDLLKRNLDNNTVQYQYILDNPLYPVKSELCNKFKSYTDIVFFTDSVESSLYPYHIARENLISSQSSDYSIHLVCVIDSENNHHNMLSDLSYVNSVAYYETNKVFRNFYYKDDIFRYSYPKDEYIRDNLREMMPYFLNFPHDKSGRYYFDFTSMSYKSIDEGVGIVEMQLPRIDGKEVCNMLRRQRMELAAANNIPFESEECPSTGACAGTCPKCDGEAEYLRKCLEKIPEEKRVYPQFDPKKEV